MTYQERLKMDALSLKAFGKKGAWNKLYQRGYPAQLTRKKDDETEETYNGIKYQTLEEIVKVMEDMIALKEKEEAEKKAKESVPEVKVEEPNV
jgi:hypothetical protein